MRHKKVDILYSGTVPLRHLMMAIWGQNTLPREGVTEMTFHVCECCSQYGRGDGRLKEMALTQKADIESVCQCYGVSFSSVS
jgi:hypothetical protein